MVLFNGLKVAKKDWEKGTDKVCFLCQIDSVNTKPVLLTLGTDNFQFAGNPGSLCPFLQ